MKSDEILEKIRNKFNDVDPNNRTLLNIFQFNFTDGNGENIIKRVGMLKHEVHFTIVIDCKSLSVFELRSEGDEQKNFDAVVTISDDDFYAIGTKVCTFEQLLNDKKIQVDGNAAAIEKMLDKFRGN